jgi:hypothetical protein
MLWPTIIELVGEVQASLIVVGVLPDPADKILVLAFQFLRLGAGCVGALGEHVGKAT